jgi:hypothetical protein
MVTNLKRNHCTKMMMNFLLLSSALVTNGCIESALVESMPPSSMFVVYEDKYKDFNFDTFKVKNNNVAVDVSFKYDYFVDGSPNHKESFTNSLIDNLKRSELFDEISIVEPDEYNNEFKIIFYVDRINYPIIKDFAMLPITVLTFNNYDHWQEHRFVIETKIYKNSKLIKDYDNKKSYYSSLYWFTKPEPKFSDYSEISGTYVRGRPPMYSNGIDSFYDEFAIDVIKGLAAEECFVNPNGPMN